MLTIAEIALFAEGVPIPHQTNEERNKHPHCYFGGIDHFKRLNDSFGHEAGDAVLRELAKVFQSHLRAEDIASRYGGEEFVLILPEADVAVASERAEQLRQAIHLVQIQHYGQTLEGISLSVGVACYPQQGNTVDALMRASDAALYRAKENGRDRVEVAKSGDHQQMRSKNPARFLDPSEAVERSPYA